MTTLAPPRAFQNQDELDQVIAVYRDRQPRCVLEIGVAHGGTLYHWLTEGHPERVVCVDTFTYADPRDQAAGWANPDTDVRTIKGDSRDNGVIERVRRLGPYDWVHIDGDHHYDVVRSDWLTYRDMVATDGVVLLHDIAYSEDVRRLWLEIEGSVSEIVAENDPLGYGIVYA